METELLLAVLIFLVVFDVVAYRYGVDSRETLEVGRRPRDSVAPDRRVRSVDRDLARQLREHRREV